MNMLATLSFCFGALLLFVAAGPVTDASAAMPEGQPEATAATTATAEAARVADASKTKASAKGSRKPKVYKLSIRSVNGIDSYADILEGESFKPIKLSARLYSPVECSESARKVPAVIIQHGSGAPKHRWYRELPRALARAGISALVPDSFSVRRLKGTARDQTPLSKANRVYDAFAAFRRLAALPCIDPDRIGITGYSFGGIVSRDVVESAIAERLGKGHVFKASLPVYPSCQSQWAVSRPTDTRVHFLLAGKDNYTPASYCIKQIPRLKAAGWNISHSVYRRAHHGFISDHPVGRSRESWTFKRCGVFRITKEGYEVSEKYNGLDQRNMTRGEFIRKAAKTCGKRGVTVGSDKKTRASAMQFTVDFFSKHL